MEKKPKSINELREQGALCAVAAMALWIAEGLAGANLPESMAAEEVAPYGGEHGQKERTAAEK